MIPRLPVGVRLKHVLRGHPSSIGRIAWSADGDILAAPSTDGTIRIWEAVSGKCLRVLAADGAVYATAFSPNGRYMAVGTANGTALWDVTAATALRPVTSSEAPIIAVDFSADDQVLGFCDTDGGVGLFDLASNAAIASDRLREGANVVAFDPTGEIVIGAGSGWRACSSQLTTRIRVAVNGGINSVAFGPDHTLISCGQTLQVWNLSTGALARVLEGHIGAVTSVAASADRRIIASKGEDGSVHLWRTDNGACIGVVSGLNSRHSLEGLAFNPRRNLLAAALAARDELEDEQDDPWVVHVWELDADALFREGPSTPMAYVTAKVVLVGDSGVGKTGLGWRLAHEEFREHSSTHGQQFWPLNQIGTQRHDGAQCEAILWDLAGQPDYRLTHSLFLDDADLALLLFDPTDETDPMKGVEFWLKQLGLAPTAASVADPSSLPRAVLVAARADRGAPVLTTEEIGKFCDFHGIGGYVLTSAKQGNGIDELLDRMRALIPWEKKPATVTTDTFKRVKDFVLELKERTEQHVVLVTPSELRSRLQADDQEWQFGDDEMITAAKHLETHGYVKLLHTSKGETRILLAPELLNNVAASFVLEARRNEKGLGSLAEKRLIEGNYTFPELQGLSTADRDVILDAATLLFLHHNICFRETDPLSGQSYLVFPDLINLKRPTLPAKDVVEDGVSYTVSGAIENVYASLVVLLGYTQTFTRTDQWKNHARYVVGDGLVCGFRQDAERAGEVDFVLYFGRAVGLPVRRLFQSLFESFLARRNLGVSRFDPVLCETCHRPLEPAVVRSRTRDGYEFAYCNNCGSKLVLPKTDEPIQLTKVEQAEVDAQRRIADQRTRFEQAVFRIQAYVKENAIASPACFVSYAWGDQLQERWVERTLSTDLQKAGINVILDRWENDRAGKSVSRFVERVAEATVVLPIGTPRYFDKYTNKVSTSGSVVAAEVDLIHQRLLASEAEKETVMPILLEGDPQVSLPPLMRSRVFVDFRDKEAYFFRALKLIVDLYGIPAHLSPARELLDSLANVRVPV